MSRTFEAVREAIVRGSVRVSQHAVEELEADDLSVDTIVSAVLAGELIEDYPDDPRGPSCLVLSSHESGDWVHTVWGWDSGSGIAVLITAYRPHPRKWEHDLKRRRR